VEARLRGLDVNVAWVPIPTLDVITAEAVIHATFVCPCGSGPGRALISSMPFH